ncbi:hypothetical protein DM02DRAFT_532181 [Periconia macrospinosa]|uniref:N-acetyltransferase domain-containing protein n=1 Tax=Periconia macrospinosa TaxID=97972 RepID=A0A2V1DLB3_9PLEO|nr:hypothetical protein DM02DRAFT_532181 [Periconia macrospinosa]
MPVEPEQRLADSEIRLELCEEKDAAIIAESLYSMFPESWWATKEPLSIRHPSLETRKARMTKRILPTFRDPRVLVDWVKAVHVPTSTVIGIAGWFAPGCPLHNPWRRSAVDFYGWKDLMGWSDEEVDEMWSGTDLAGWDDEMAKNDEDRRRYFDGEEHWFLAPLITWKEWQGKGVGSKLLNWGIEKADREGVPLYLESAPTARAVYLHSGFVPLGKVNMVRRGPRVVNAGAVEAEERKRSGEKASVGVAETEVKSEVTEVTA